MKIDSKKASKKVGKNTAAEAVNENAETIIAEHEMESIESELVEFVELDATPEVSAAAELDDIDAELAALIDEMPEIAPAASMTESIVDIDEIAAALEASDVVETVKAESYAAQTSDGAFEAESNEPITTPVVTTLLEAKKRRSGGSAPRGKSGQTAGEVIASWSADELLRAAFLTKTQLVTDEDVEALKVNVSTLAKKVGEKAINILRHRDNPAGLQTYTRTALNMLVERGTLTSKELTDTLMQSYQEGTARSQCNQIMQLFPALKIAKRDGSTLELNADSVLASTFSLSLSS